MSEPKLEERVRELFSASDELSVQMVTAAIRAELLKAADFAEMCDMDCDECNGCGARIAFATRRQAE